MNEPRHHLQRGELPRVRLCQGPTVDQHTLATLAEWQAKGVSYGELIDRLVTHCLSTGYDPVTCLPSPTLKKQNPRRRN